MALDPKPRNSSGENDIPLPSNRQAIPLSSQKKATGPRARMSCVSVLYHQVTGENPVSWDARWSRVLESDEQPYVRKATATEEWADLDKGWVKSSVSMVQLRNESRDATLWVGVRFPQAVVLLCSLGPGEALPGFPPAPGLSLCLKSYEGTCKYTLVVLPG